MMSNIAATITLLCLLQTSTCQNIFIDLSTQIAAAKTHVDEVIHLGGTQIGQTRTNIGTTISQAETNVQNQRNQLDNIVEEARIEANQKGVDISTCINDLNTALSEIDFGSFGTCSSHDELNLLGVQLGNLGVVKRNLSSSLSKCSSSHLGDNEGLKVCVQNDINNAHLTVTAIQEEINNVCDDAIKNAQACTQTILERLDKSIDTVAHNLKNCLLNIL